MAASAGESGLQSLKDWVDIAQKLIIGVCVALVTGLWVARKEQLSGDKICVDIQSATIDTVRADGPSLEEIQARVDLVPANCDIDRNKFLRLLSELASRKREAKVAETAGSNVTKSTESGAAAPPASTAPQKAFSDLEGWVAYGFRSPTAYSETNFDIVSRASSAAGEPADMPSKGSILKARWQVNMRKAAADWTNPVTVVQIGQCLKVGEAKALSAGPRQQIWAGVTGVDCP